MMSSTPTGSSNSANESVHEGSYETEYLSAIPPPMQIPMDLFLRHRSPSIANSVSEHTNSTKHRRELQRILQDGATQVKHSVLPEGGEQASEDNITTRSSSRRMELPSWTGSLTQLPMQSRYWKQQIKKTAASFPMYIILKDYNCSKLKSDVVAGITVAILAIPLGMSYARLAGLPSYYGLYGSFVPPLLYPFFGTSRQLQVGPAALLSLLVSQGVGDIVAREGLMVGDEDYVARYTQLAIQCSALAGVLNLALGICRLGFVTQFLSRALISGFTSGAAVIIASSQIQHILGFPIPSSNKIHKIAENLATRLDQFDWPTFVLGVSCIFVLVGTKNLAQNEKLKAKHPQIKWVKALAPIMVSVISMLLVFTMDLESKGIRIVGEIPKGLPSVSLKMFENIHPELWLVATSMVIVGFVQSISISKSLAYKHSYEIAPSQELVAFGVANLIGSIFQSYPTTGGMGQSAVNDEIGAETGIASIVTGLVVMVVLLFLTPAFEYMPLAVLASIVISFVLGMFDYTEAIYLYRVHKFDFLVWIVAFFGTMFLGVEYGLIIAISVSLLLVLYESAYPHTAVLGRLPGTTVYRNIKQYPNAERYDGVVIVRLDAPLYFANALNVRDKIRKYKCQAVDELQARNSTNTVQYIILDLSPVSHIDTTGLHMLEDMYATQKRLGVQLCLCNPGIKVTQRLLQCRIADFIGRQYIFSSDIDAVQWCLQEMDDQEMHSLDLEDTKELDVNA